MNRLLVCNNPVWEDQYQLVRNFIKGDFKCGEKLYYDCFPLVKNYIRKKTTKKEISEFDIEDITNKVLYTTFIKIENYTGKSLFSTWVCGFANNIIMTELKKLDRLSKKTVELNNNYNFKSDNPLDIIIKKELSDTIIKCVNTLPALDKKIIVDKIIYNYTFVKISKQTGIEYYKLRKRYRLLLEVMKWSFLKLYYKIS